MKAMHISFFKEKILLMTSISMIISQTKNLSNSSMKTVHFNLETTILKTIFLRIFLMLKRQRIRISMKQKREIFNRMISYVLNVTK